jgi:hypothetical protein
MMIINIMRVNRAEVFTDCNRAEVITMMTDIIKVNRAEVFTDYNRAEVLLIIL